MKSFFPSSLHRIQHEAARLTLAGQNAAARCVIEQALADARQFLGIALNTSEALAIVEATARLLTETARARQFLDDDKPEPPPLPPLPPHGGGSPFPAHFDWEAM